MNAAVDLDSIFGPVAPSPQAVAVGGPPVASAVAAGGTAFEGASTFDQLALWGPSIRSADADILPEKKRLDSRTRDILRNDAYVAGGATLHKDNIVGSMYLLNAKPKTKILFGKDDETWESEFQEEVESKFTLWAESDQFWIDAQRTKTLTDFVRLAVGVHLAGGEVLASAEWMPNDGRPFRSAVQMIDTDRLSDPLDRIINPINSNIKGGIETDLRGAPIAYYIRTRHPSEYRPSFSDQNTWRRVMARTPWGRPKILHLYDQSRAGQTRGIAAMVAALQEMKMLKSFRKVELQRAVLAATYAASIESELPNAEVFRAMGGDGGDVNPAIKFMQEYLTAINEYSGGSKNLAIDGVKIPVFMPGTKLNLTNPGADSPAGDKFEMSALRYVAAALGVSYEQLSRDYTNTNYSSSRASRGETEKAMQSKKRKVADAAANFVYRLWLEEAINGNQIEALKRKNIPNFYEGLNTEAYTNCEWIGAASGLVDPLKETQAYVLQINNKLVTREYVMAKMYGQDWRSTGKQIAREATFFDKLKIELPENVQQDMQNSLTGNKSANASAQERAAIEEVVREVMEDEA